MKRRDMTVTSKIAVPGTANSMIRINATNYAGDGLQMDLLRAEAEGFHVYDIVTVTIEKRGGVG